MKKQIVVASVLALLFYPSFLKSAQANPIAPPVCKDIPSCGVAGIIIGTEVVGGILYYVVQNAAGRVHKVRSRQQHPPAHRTNEQYEEELHISSSSTGCYDLAERKSRETGKQWRVKKNKLMRGTGGVARPGYLLQWECTITTEPEN